ncbi:MAG TPA: aldose 1-epimerase family protein [Ilumatobacteraceae bacterium]|nr:aldose 1-epimerase family protein [Ilumatobacteraceae bacterium]
MPRPRSGRQYTLRRGDLVAEVASIGASLRSLQVGNRDLVLSFNAEEIRPLFRGCVLAPWPNRIAGGRWTYGGQEHQLAITEPARGHALHGLVAWLDWNEIDSSADTVSLGTTIVPQQGYPYQFDLTMRWSLEEAALVGRLSAVNAGSEAAPFGCSIHPYLVAPGSDMNEWMLHVPATHELQVDDDLIPTMLTAVPEAHDFHEPRPIGSAAIDHALHGFDFTGGTSSVSLVDQQGDGVRVVFSAETPWVQVCTSDWPGRVGHRAGVAVEPMTCPPNAFATAPEMYLVAPGETSTASWRLEVVGG